MKIKNSVHAISPDSAIILMCLGMLIACPLRIFQMLKNIDPQTGFYNDYNSITIVVLYAILATVSVLILFFTFLSARIPAAKAPAGRRIPLGVASFVFAATLFYDAVSGYFTAGEATTTIIQNVRSVSAMHHLHAVFAFLSCCYFVVMCISYISGNLFHKKLKLLSLSPLVWAIVRVLERITVIISIVRVSELLLELCGLVFLMIFFLTFARVVSDVNCKGSMWSVIGCGCISTLFIMTYSIPRLMLLFTGNADSLVVGYPVNFSDLGCAFFILMFVITTLRCGYTVADVEEMNAEISETIDTEDDEAENEEETLLAAKDVDGNISLSKPVDNDADDSAKD